MLLSEEVAQLELDLSETGEFVSNVVTYAPGWEDPVQFPTSDIADAVRHILEYRDRVSDYTDDVRCYLYADDEGIPIARVAFNSEGFYVTEM